MGILADKIYFNKKNFIFWIKNSCCKHFFSYQLIYFNIFIIFDRSGINSSSWGIEKLILRSIVQIKIFLWLTQSLTGLAYISTSINILVSNKKILDFICLMIFLVSGFLAFHKLISLKAIRILFHSKSKGVISCFGYNINTRLDNSLQAI